MSMKMRQVIIITPLLCGLVFSGSADEVETLRRELAWKTPLREQESIRWGKSSPIENMARLRELSAENTETNRFLVGVIYEGLPQAVPSTAGRQTTKTTAFNVLVHMQPPLMAKHIALSTLAKEIGALHAARWGGQDIYYPRDLIFAATDFLARSFPEDPDVVEALTKYAGDNWIREDVRELFQKHLSDRQPTVERPHPLVPFPPTRLSISQIEQAIQVYRMTHNGKLPDTLDELVQGTKDTPPLLHKEHLHDFWGEPFRYEREGHKFIIKSSGPDRQMGTADDITN